MPPPPRFIAKRTLKPQQAPGLYVPSYTPERGAAICRRLAAGESLRAICREDPAMPTEKTVWNWARAHEDFALMKAHALGLARARSLAAQRERDAARQAALGRGRCRAWNAGLDGYDEEVADAILLRLMRGEGLSEVCRDPRLPCVGTAYNWMRRHPEFLEQYRRAKGLALEIMLEEACEPLPWLGERKSWPMLRRTVKAVERHAGRRSLKRYAPAQGPAELQVVFEAPDGTVRVIYGEGAGETVVPDGPTGS